MRLAAVAPSVISVTLVAPKRPVLTLGATAGRRGGLGAASEPAQPQRHSAAASKSPNTRPIFHILPYWPRPTPSHPCARLRTAGQYFPIPRRLQVNQHVQSSLP